MSVTEIEDYIMSLQPSSTDRIRIASFFGIIKVSLRFGLACSTR